MRAVLTALTIGRMKAGKGGEGGDVASWGHSGHTGLPGRNPQSLVRVHVEEPLTARV